MTTTQALRLEAVKAALEWSKQVTTLATGVLALSVAFIELYAPDPDWKLALVIGWLLMALSIVAGLLYLGAVIAHLQKSNGDVDPYEGAQLPIAVVHVCTFFLGLVFFMVFVGANVVW